MRPTILNLIAGSLLAGSLLAGAALADGVATRDTTYLLGGPERWDGRFETPDGQPDWHGWTYAEGFDPHWQISGYQVPPGGGTYTMWCGKTFANDCAEGYGNDWTDDLVYTDIVANPNVDNDIKLECVFNCDLEEGHDTLVFQMLRNDQWLTIAGPYGGHLVGEILDVTVTFHPGDYIGPFGDIIQLRALVTTDGAGSDEDCLFDSVGACQIDNLRVTFPDGFSRYEDWEDQSAEFWHPTFPPHYVVPQLGANLPDPDPDQDNTSWQVNWLDYVDPPGDPDELFTGLIYSPPLAMPDEVDAMILAFDVCVNNQDLFYEWHVRSTASDNPDDLQGAAWVNENFLNFSTPGFHRLERQVSGLLVPGARWMQVSIDALEIFTFMNLQGEDTPYFDNVVVKAAVPAGPTGVPQSGGFLVRAYPNPFNPLTTIAFEMPEARWAEVTVFDLRGRLVRRLVAGEFGAGRQEVEWDGRDDARMSVAAGSYLCRVRAGERQAVIRMTLVR